MNEKRIKVIADPIYNLIVFDKDYDKAILDVIDAKEFQRLRRIKQLGFSCFTYPSGLHDRFTHSIGVSFLIGKIFDALNIPDVIEFKEQEQIYQIPRRDFKLLVQLAGLLHDIGHGPFSHAFEKVSGVHHEKLSVDIINNEKLGIFKALQSIENPILRENAPRWIGMILQKKFPITWAKDLISSQIDADRIDYLLRDAYMCGVEYVSFKVEWLIRNMQIHKIEKLGNKEGIVINAKKGLHSLEAFIVSRYHMYEQVYYHKTTAGFEKLIVLILQRFKELIESGKEDMINFCSKDLKDFMLDPKNVEKFLILDDYFIFSHLNIWSRTAKDDILRSLSKCIIERKPFKLIKEVENDRLFDLESYVKIDKVFESQEEKKYFYFEENYTNTAYKDDYLLGNLTADDSENIWVITKNGKIEELSQHSSIINALRNNMKKNYRAYVHRDLYDKLI